MDKKLILHFGTKEFELAEDQENPMFGEQPYGNIYRLQLAHGGELVFRLTEETDYAVEERPVESNDAAY
jgi:hypothetical protein